MKRLFALLALVLLGLAPVRAQDLELVESFPIETDFDQPDLRQAQTVWLEMIGRARSEILWQTFYLAHEKGRATEPVLAALKEAAKRGVRVELLVDPKFYTTYPETLDELDALDGIEVRRSSVGPWLGGVMHAKAVFVDGQEGFIGSQNLDWRSLEHIRELGVHFRSPELTGEYVKAFRWEWEHAGEPAPPLELAKVTSVPLKVGGSTVMATFSPNSLNAATAAGDEAEILKLLDSAESSVEVALLTYSPLDHAGKNFYPALDNALRRADVRGVKVRLLLSHWVEGKKGEDHLRSLDALDNVEIRACRIPQAKEGEIPFARVHHSKYLVCDAQKAWLGTSNWQEDYFHSSRNYGLIFLDGPIPARLHNLFEFDWQRSTALGMP
jgi:phosphatidylserine/phosphatidylglycerophosphate/cardiolipin synthase-like enzyme